MERYLDKLFKKYKLYQNRIRLLAQINDPEHEINLVRNYILQLRGYNFIACRNNYYYKTELSYDSNLEDHIEFEKEFGWDSVSNFKVKPWEDRIYVLYKHPAPSFFYDKNPWKDKGPLSWLPDLNNDVPSDFRQILECGGGHGFPSVGRRYCCRCGEKNLKILKNEDQRQVASKCWKCNHWQILIDVESIIRETDPKSPPEKSFAPYTCECGNDQLSIFFLIEYSAQSIGAWNFSWVVLNSLCPECDTPHSVYSVEAE